MKIPGIALLASVLLAGCDHAPDAQALQTAQARHAQCSVALEIAQRNAEFCSRSLESAHTEIENMEASARGKRQAEIQNLQQQARLAYVCESLLFACPPQFAAESRKTLDEVGVEEEIFWVVTFLRALFFLLAWLATGWIVSVTVRFWKARSTILMAAKREADAMIAKSEEKIRNAEANARSRVDRLRDQANEAERQLECVSRTLEERSARLKEARDRCQSAYKLAMQWEAECAALKGQIAAETDALEHWRNELREIRLQAEKLRGPMNKTSSQHVRPATADTDAAVIASLANVLRPPGRDL